MEQDEPVAPVPERKLPRLLVLDVVRVIPNRHPFTVTFLKKNGERRRLRCQIDGDEAVSVRRRDESPDVLVVFDLEKQALRSFRTDAVLSILI